MVTGPVPHTLVMRFTSCIVVQSLDMSSASLHSWFRNDLPTGNSMFIRIASCCDCRVIPSGTRIPGRYPPGSSPIPGSPEKASFLLRVGASWLYAWTFWYKHLRDFEPFVVHRLRGGHQPGSTPVPGSPGKVAFSASPCVSWLCA